MSKTSHPKPNANAHFFYFIMYLVNFELLKSKKLTIDHLKC